MVCRNVRDGKLTRTLGICGGLVMLADVAHAQSNTPGGMPPPPGMSLTESAAMRFPQPVRVGDLVGRDVLRPVESQDVLGHVRAVVRDSTGQILVVIDFGGLFAFRSRPIPVLPWCCWDRTWRSWRSRRTS